MLPLPSVLLREQLGLRAVPHPLIALSFSTDRNANVMKLSPFVGENGHAPVSCSAGFSLAVLDSRADGSLT